jgi:hypothetical protein
MINAGLMSNPTFYQPFVSTSVSVSSPYNSLQGIKKNGLSLNSYVITGTTGDAAAPPGYGALYVGAIDGATNPTGSGSGTWYNFSVPSTWGPQETSTYGPDVLSSGSGPGGIGDIALAGTWINSSGTVLGWYYQGGISALNGDTSGAVVDGFQQFQATTNKGRLARYTYLHSIDGGYVVGNYSTSGGPIGFALNSGPGSGSYIYNPESSTQINLSFSDSAKYHSAFGIWQNENQTYTISGGASKAGIKSYGKKVKQAVRELREIMPDAAFGKGMLADVDPITGVTSNLRSYNYVNEANGSIGLLTHFQGIYSIGGDVYQAPFVSVTKGGTAYAGNAYIHRLSNGKFSKNALWQTFEPTTDGSAIVATSVAGDASTGVFSNEAPFASFGSNEYYFLEAQNLR